MCRFWPKRIVWPMHLDGLFSSEKVLKELGVVEIIDKTRVSFIFKTFLSFILAAADEIILKIGHQG